MVLQIVSSIMCQGQNCTHTPMSYTTIFQKVTSHDHTIVSQSAMEYSNEFPESQGKQIDFVITGYFGNAANTYWRNS